MQLVAYGAQDIYLTGNPQITFFKVVYRRHTNFAVESIEQTFNGTPNFGNRTTATISRNGDLIQQMYLEVLLPFVTVGSGSPYWTYGVGNAMIQKAEIEIGGQLIDRHYGEWMDIWTELSVPAGKRRGYDDMVGNWMNNYNNQWTGVDASTGEAVTTGDNRHIKLYVPLQFWFNRNPGLALPLIALQYHEVKLNLELRNVGDLVNGASVSGSPSLTSGGCRLYVDYVYLDTDERRRFAQTSHEYLIEQLQYTGAESVNSTSNKIKLNFNHPVKELIWVVQPDSNVDSSATQAVGGPQWFNYTDALDVSPFAGTPGSPLGEGIIGAGNSMNAGSMTQALYLGQGAAAVVDQGIGLGNTNPEVTAANPIFVQNSQLPGFSVANSANVALATAMNVGLASANYLLDRGNNPTAEAKLQLNGHDRFSARDGRYFNLVQPFQHHTNCPSVGINVYSFGLKPEEHQPSGTCNMSRIDNATLQLTLTSDAVANARSCKVRVYATNYNVLRIMSGMGGLNHLRKRITRAEKQYAIVKRPLTIENHFTRRININNPRLTASNIWKQMLQHILLFGKPLRAFSTKVYSESINWPRVINLGMVIMERIGQPACLLPKGDMLANGGASETERMWVINDGLSNQRWLKIQSGF